MPDAAAEVPAGSGQRLVSPLAAHAEQLLESAPDGVVIIDAEGLILLVNRQAELLFGYDRAELLGQPVDLLVPERARAVHDSHRVGYFANPSLRPMGTGLDLVARRKDGTEFPVEISLSSLQTPEGVVASASVRDVTRQRKLETDLQRMNEAMRMFVATASHDLRTPLASLLGFAQLLEAGGKELSIEQRAECVSAIHRAARQASRLVDDLLTLSKFEAGRLDVRSERVALRPAIAAAVEECAPGAAVTCGDGIAVWVDPDHLRRMLVNYLSNAVQYGAPPVEVSVADAGDGIEIRVSDSGSGVPPDLVDRLFTSFARAQHANRDSTGLGLSIVKGLAEANGGQVFYEPRATGGSCFGLRLVRGPLGTTEQSASPSA
jgi:PAS domain S-box-containing protein